MKKLRFLVILILVLMLSACGPAAPVATPTATQTGVQPTPTGPQVESVVNKEMTLSFAFGERKGVYSGEIQNDLPHGTGVFTSRNEDGVDWTYEGGWEDGHHAGAGKTVWSNGYMDEGMYKDDYLNGEGRTYKDNKLLYEGEYTDDEYDGQGTLYNQHGDVIYSGSFDTGFLDESAADRKARLTPFKKQCVSMSYKDMMNGGDQLEGAKIKVTGTISETYDEDKGDEEWFEFYMYIGNKKDDYVGVDYILSTGEKTFKEGDKVTMWGTLVSIYTDTDGSKEYTYPYFEAYSVEAAKEPVKTPAPTKAPVKTPAKTAAPSQSIVNAWICQQGQYTSVYSFESNGTYTGYFADDMGDFSESGRYSVSGSTIYFYPDGSESYSLSYRLSGSKLTLTYGDGSSFTHVIYEP